jgi:hypothetical protein
MYEHGFLKAEAVTEDEQNLHAQKRSHIEVTHSVSQKKNKWSKQKTSTKIKSLGTAGSRTGHPQRQSKEKQDPGKDISKVQGTWNSGESNLFPQAQPNQDRP